MTSPRRPTAASPRNTTQTRTATGTPPAAGTSGVPGAPAAPRKWHQRGEVVAVIGLSAVLFEAIIFALLGVIWGIVANLGLALAGAATHQLIKHKNPGWLRKLIPSRLRNSRLFSGGRPGPARFGTSPSRFGPSQNSRNPFRRMFSSNRTPTAPGSKPRLRDRLGWPAKKPAAAPTRPAGGQAPRGTPPKPAGRGWRRNRQDTTTSGRGRDQRRDGGRSRRASADGTDEPRSRVTWRDRWQNLRTCPECEHYRRDPDCVCPAWACPCDRTTAESKDGQDQAMENKEPGSKNGSAKKPPEAPPDRKPYFRPSQWPTCDLCHHGYVVSGCDCRHPDCFCQYQDLPAPPPREPAAYSNPSPVVPQLAEEDLAEEDRAPDHQPQHAAEPPRDWTASTTGRKPTMKTNHDSLQGYVKDTAAWEEAAAEVSRAKRAAEAAEEKFKEATTILVSRGQNDLATSDRLKAELDDYATRAKAATTGDDYASLADHARALSKVAHNEHEADMDRAHGRRAPIHIEHTSDVVVASGEV